MHNKFLTLCGNDFQSWIEKVLKILHPADFQRIRMTQGDGGLDGFVLNRLRVYQCFGPRSFTDGEAAQKIRADFATAHEFLEGNFREWIFVHNDREDRIGKETVKALAEIKAQFPSVTIEVWGFSRLWENVSNADPELRSEILGVPITDASMSEVQFPEIEHVLLFVRDRELPIDAVLGAMPDPEKLSFNDLSEEAKEHLRLGGRKEGLVGRYLEASYRITYGERIAEGFRTRYRELVKQGLEPDAILAHLLEFAGWKPQTDVKLSSAVFAVLCYFFNACDIFENPPTP